MPAYQYEALSDDGATQRGVIEADTAKAARGLLRQRGLVPLAVDTVSAGQREGETSLLNRRIGGRNTFSSVMLAVWTRQLAGLVAAGLPLERALGALADEAETPQQQGLVAALRAEVNGGASFAAALAQHPREFSDTYRAVVAAGEQSGRLDKVLLALADELEERQALNNKLLGAMLYPAIVSGISVLIVIFLVTYVVPQVASVFTGQQRSLPFLTTLMLGISAAVRQYGWLMALVLAGAGALLWRARGIEATRLRMDAAWLTLPLVGRLSRSYNAARFATTLAMLADAGVPILKALQTAADTLSNRAMRQDALDALVLVREGAPLGHALASKKRFPALVPMFARLGEQTGQLPAMLSRAAQQLSGEVQRRAMHLATVLEPLLIVGMGLVVMAIVLAVLLPIIELNQLVKT